ncbi:MAG: hypothetical protein U0491_03635 [Candidatus Saccharimonadales bacterium]
MKSAFERFDSLSLPSRVATIAGMAGLAIFGLRTVDADGVNHRVYYNNVIDSVICSGHDSVLLEAGTTLESLAEQKGYSGSMENIYIRDSIKQIGEQNIGTNSENEVVVAKDTIATLAESCD